MSNTVTLGDIREAQTRLRGIALRTRLIEFPIPPDLAHGRRLFLKPENQQPIGAFKLRGAYNKIDSLSEQDRKRGVITYSSGNHAQGVAYAARALGVKAVIVMPNNAPEIKQEATARLGAEIVLVRPGQRRAQSQGRRTRGPARIHNRPSIQRREDHRRPGHHGTGDPRRFAGGRNGPGARRRWRHDQRRGRCHQVNQALNQSNWRGTGAGGRRSGQLPRRQDPSIPCRAGFSHHSRRPAHAERRRNQLRAHSANLSTTSSRLAKTKFAKR